MMIWKRYDNFGFFHKIWKAYLEWYTSALGMDYLKWFPEAEILGHGLLSGFVINSWPLI